jgi:hypothetical protein
VDWFCNDSVEDVMFGMVNAAMLDHHNRVRSLRQ